MRKIYGKFVLQKKDTERNIYILFYTSIFILVICFRTQKMGKKKVKKMYPLKRVY